MQPVARARYLGKARGRKERLYRLAVLGPDIVRLRPRQEQHRAVELPCRTGPADDLGHLRSPAHRGSAASAAAPTFKSSDCRKNARSAGSSIRCGQAPRPPRPAWHPVQRHRAHRRDILRLLVGIGHGRDIGHDQPADQIAPRQRQHPSRPCRPSNGPAHPRGRPDARSPRPDRPPSRGSPASANRGLSPWLRMSTATTSRRSASRRAMTPQFRPDPKSPCAISSGGRPSGGGGGVADHAQACVPSTRPTTCRFQSC